MLDKIIKLLKISGKGTKNQVVQMLENMSLEDLVMFKRDIQERINKINGSQE